MLFMLHLSEPLLFVHLGLCIFEPPLRNCTSRPKKSGIFSRACALVVLSAFLIRSPVRGGEREKCRDYLEKQTKKKKSRKTKTGRIWWVKNQERSWFLTDLWVKRQTWTCEPACCRNSALVSVMSCDLWERGTKKKERNLNKSVAGDFLFVFVCAWNAAVSTYFTICFMASN